MRPALRRTESHAEAVGVSEHPAGLPRQGMRDCSVDGRGRKRGRGALSVCFAAPSIWGYAIITIIMVIWSDQTDRQAGWGGIGRGRPR